MFDEEDFARIDALIDSVKHKLHNSGEVRGSFAASVHFVRHVQALQQLRASMEMTYHLYEDPVPPNLPSLWADHVAAATESADDILYGE